MDAVGEGISALDDRVERARASVETALNELVRGDSSCAVWRVSSPCVCVFFSNNEYFRRFLSAGEHFIA